jgi:hypothetical protein
VFIISLLHRECSLLRAGFRMRMNQLNEDIRKQGPVKKHVANFRKNGS